jgi:hypothetical protein
MGPHFNPNFHGKKEWAKGGAMGGGGLFMQHWAAGFFLLAGKIAGDENTE